jgi:hypothetical protein
MGCKGSEVQILSPRQTEGNAVISQDMAAFFYVQDQDNSNMVTCLVRFESLDMVDYYAQLVDEDLLQEHKAHSPVNCS